MISEELIEELKKYPGAQVVLEGCDCYRIPTGAMELISPEEVLIKSSDY